MDVLPVYMESNYFTEGTIRLVIVLDYLRRHIVGSCWGKQRCILFVERNHVGFRQ